MRALVTGAYGFVGANLVRRLLDDGHEVHVTARPGSDDWRLAGVRDDVEGHETDLLDAPGVKRMVARVRPDCVFHLAAHGAYSWQRDAAAALQVNLVGTAHLAEAASEAGVGTLVHAGSSSEYGFKDHAPSEDEIVEPNSPYAVGKAAATSYCRFVARRDGRRLITLRLYSVYGPFEEPGRLVPTLIQLGLRDELPPLVGPETARDFVYVDDVTDAFVRAATTDGVEPDAVLNIGSGAQTTLRDVVSVAKDVLEISAEPGWGTHAPRDWDTAVWVADTRRAVAQLGWAPRVDFREGLRRTAEWMREGGLRTRYAGEVSS